MQVNSGLFPACAGVIPLDFFIFYVIITFPRVCGGDPWGEQAGR